MNAFHLCHVCKAKHSSHQNQKLARAWLFHTRGNEKRRAMNKQNQSAKTAPPPLRLGFVPLTDCAPLVRAQELGAVQKIRPARPVEPRAGLAALHVDGTRNTNVDVDL